MNLDKRKLYGTIIGSIAFLAVILAFTYARYVWRSSDTNLSFNISDEYFYCESGFEEKVTGLSPVSNYRENLDDVFVQEFMVNNIGRAQTSFSVNINIDSSTDESLFNESLKYKLVVDKSGGSNICTDASVTGCEEVIEGDFSNFKAGMNVIAESLDLPNNVRYQYYLFVYIDDDASNPVDMQNKKLVFTLDVCEVVAFFDYNGGNKTLDFLKLASKYVGLPTPTYNDVVISYNSNGGGTVTNQTVNYDFEGWYLDNNKAVTDSDYNEFETKVTEGSAVSKVTNHTLHAKWDLKETIGTSNDGCVTLPTVSKTGYKFVGWYSDSELTTKVGDANASYCLGMGAASHTLYAKWAAIKYTIAYNYDGGTKGNKAPTSGTYNIATEISNPTKTGYQFAGWTSNSSTGLNTSTAKTGTTSSPNTTWSGSKTKNTYFKNLRSTSGTVTLTANWEKILTATFYYYNGASTTASCTVASGAGSCTATIPSTAISTVPSGFTLRGWSISNAANATTSVAASATTVTLTSNVNYYASYEEKVTVTFYYSTLTASATTYSGHTGTTTTATAKRYASYNSNVINSTVTVPAAVKNSKGGVAAENYEGVSKSKNSAVVLSDNQITTETTTYYAVYQEDLTFYYYNGSSHTSKNYKRRLLYNSSYGAVLCDGTTCSGISAPTPSAYSGISFNSWSTSSTTVDKKNPLQTGVNELFAIYPKTLTVTYNANGGSGTVPSNQTGTKYYISKDGGINEKNFVVTIATNNLTKSGYNANGWNTAADGSGTKYTDGSSTNITSDLTLYAQFNKIITATFKYHNDATKTVTCEIKSGSSCSITAPEALGTPSGYTFRGWSTSDTADATIAFNASASTTLSANTTYYASYKKDITATFNYSTIASTSYTYTVAASTKTAIATKYLNYIGAEKNNNFTIPSEVSSSSGGVGAPTILGYSNSQNSVTTVTPSTANSSYTYYTVYYEDVKFYYYNGSSHTNQTIRRRLLCNNGTYTMSLASTPTTGSYTDASGTIEFSKWSIKTDAVDERKPLETGVAALYATYQRDITVTYDANGGTGTVPTAQTGTKSYISKDQLYTVNPSITISANNLTKTGYTASNWNTVANGSGTDYTGGTAYTITNDITLYSKWTANQYTITLDGNGATTAGTSSVKTTYGSSTINPSTITLPQRVFTVSGFRTAPLRKSDGAIISSTSNLTSTSTLTGWYTTTSGGSKVLTNTTTPTFEASVSGYTNSSKQWTKTSNTTLYARWTGQAVTLPTITKTGYVCGWTTSSTGTTIGYASGASYTPTSATTMYAVCVGNSYTVTADAQSGTIPTTTGWTVASGNATATKSVTYGSTYSTLPSPTKTGYTFKGWSLVPDEYQQVDYIQSSGTQYIDTGYYWQNENTEIYFDGTVITNSADQSLFGNEEIINSGGDRYFSGIPHGANGSYNIYLGDESQGTAATTIGTRFNLDIKTTSAKMVYVHTNGIQQFSKTYTGSVKTFSNAYTTSTNSTTVGHIYLFANHNSNNGASDGAIQNVSSMRVYAFKLYDNNTLVRDLVPCYRKIDNVVGMYDRANNKFYANKGTGTFSYGSATYITSSSTVSVPGNHKIYAIWQPNNYTVTFNSNNLLYGLENVSDIKSSNMTYSVNNKVVTVTGNASDGYGYTNGRVYLVAGQTYQFSMNSSGTYGTVEAFLMLNGTTSKYYRMSSLNCTFTPDTTGIYWLRLDVNADGTTHTFSNITIKYSMSTTSAMYDSDMPSVTPPVRTGYTFGGYYSTMNAIDMTYTKETFTSTTRLSFLGSNNGWKMTTADEGTHLQGVIKVVDSTLSSAPVLEFNDVGLTNGTDYKVTSSNGTYTYSIDFDINSIMVSNRNYGFDTNYRFFDLENVSSNSTVTVEYMTKDGKKYYNSSGTSLHNYDIVGTTTLYAKWTPISYKIAYNLNSGTAGSSAPTTATYDNRVNISNPTRTGYTFAGWTFNGNTSTAKHGTITSMDTAWSSTSTKVTNSYFRNLTSTSGATVTLTANWTANSYTVTLTKGTGISAVSGAGTYTVGSTATISATAASGYTWSGWTGTYSSTNNPYTFTMPASNVTLTANAKSIAAPGVPTYTAFYDDGSGNYTSGTWTNKYVKTTISTTDNGGGASYIQYTTTPSTESSWSTLNLGGTGLTQSGTTTTWSGTEGWTLKNRNDTFYFRACNSAGVCSAASTGFNIKYDITAPGVPTYTAFYADGGASYTSGTWANKEVHTTISATDAGSGVDKIQYMLKSSYDEGGTTWSTFNFAEITPETQKTGLHQVGTTTTWNGTESWGVTDGRNNSYYFRACDKLGQCSSVSSVYNIKYDTSAPTCTLTSTSTLKATSQTVTTSAINGNASGIAKYYWGQTSTGTPSATTKPTMTANAAGTWYLRILDNAGNIGSCSITMRSYTYNHYLLSTTGTKGTYNTTNYPKSGSTSSTYIIPNGSTLTMSSLYAAPTNASSSTYKGYSTGTAGTTSVTPSTATTATISANTTYNFWFDRSEYSVTLIKGTGISAVSGAGTYRAGASVKVEATVLAGYTWDKWTGTYTSTNNPYTFTMPASKVTLTANAKSSGTYTITYDYENEIYNHNTTDWTFHGSSAVNNSYSYNNTIGLQVYSTSSAYTGVRIPINSEKKTNTNYELEVRAKRTGSIGGTLRAYATTNNSSGGVLSYNHGINITNDNATLNEWTKFTYSFNSGAYASWDTIYIDYAEANLGPVYVSDISLDEISTVSKTGGSTLGTLPTPTRSGYTFKGWYTAENGGGSKVSSTTTVTANTRLYAYWLDETKPSASITMSSTLKVSNQATTLACTDNIGVVSYYWGKSEPTNTSSYTKIAPTTSMSINKTVSDAGTYYLACKDAAGNVSTTASNVVYSYTVNNLLLNLDGAKGTYTTANYTQKSTATYIAPASTKIYFTQVYTVPTNGVFAVASVGAASTTAPSTTYTNYVTLGANRTYSIWFNRVEATVSLTAGTGISGVSGAGTYRAGATVTIDATVAAGHTWNKWTGTYDSTTKNYSFTMPASNVSLTANASAYTYKVIYNCNGGTGGATITHTYGTAKNLETGSSICSKADHTFINWKGSNNTTYSSGQQVTNLTSTNGGTFTMTAQWQAENYSVTTAGGSTTYRQTLADAISAVNSGGTVTALKTQTDGSTSNISVAKAVTINTGTYTVTTSVTILANTGATITKAGSGTLASSVNTINLLGGKVIMSAGTMSTSAGDGYNVMWMNGNYGASNLTISGGVITRSATTTSYAVGNGGAGTITMTGGSVLGSGRGIYNGSSGVVNITGGTLNSTGGVIIGNASSGPTTVSATVGSSSNTSIALYNTSTGTLTMTGGSAQCINNSCVVNSGTNGWIKIRGGTITSNQAALYNSGAGVMDVGYDGNTGTITITSTGASYGAFYCGAATAGSQALCRTYAGTRITAAGHGVYLNGGDFRVYKGTKIESTSSSTANAAVNNVTATYSTSTLSSGAIRRWGSFYISQGIIQGNHTGILSKSPSHEGVFVGYTDVTFMDYTKKNEAISVNTGPWVLGTNTTDGRGIKIDIDDWKWKHMNGFVCGKYAGTNKTTTYVRSGYVSDGTNRSDGYRCFALMKP